MTSSISWKASPAWRPNASSASTSSADAPAYSAPTAQAQPSSAPVLASAMTSTSSRVTSPGARFSMAVSACWPSHSSTTQSASRAAAAGDAGCGSSASSRRASAWRASPARIASASPNTVHAVGRCRMGGVPVHHVVVQQREVVDQFHRRGGPQRARPCPLAAECGGGGEDEGGADRLARVARRRCAVRVLPPEVVERDPAHRAGQRVDRRAQSGVDGRPDPLQDHRRLVPVGRLRPFRMLFRLRPELGHGVPLGESADGDACAATGRVRPGCTRPSGRGHRVQLLKRHLQRPISTFSRTPRASGTRTAAE